MDRASAQRRPAWRVAIGVGVAQTIAWGILYYSIAALGAPMARAATVSEPTVYAAFTVCLLVAGLLAPWAGKLVDRRSGRGVLMAGAIVAAAGMAVLAIASSPALLFAGWSLNGIAMALGLYDVAFAAVYQERRGDGRRVVTGVTLLAGFASTIFWPLSRHLAHVVGLRATFVVFAVLLLSTVPMYGWSLGSRRQGEPSPSSGQPIESRSGQARTIALLAAAFATASFVTGAIGAHLLSTLGALSVPATQVTWVASLLGVTQVAGRILEVSLGSRTSPIRTGSVALAALATSFVLLAMTAAAPSLAWAFVVVFGMSNGVLTIARATIPVALFGSEGIGDVLGRLARPAVVARAVAPWCFAVVADAAGSAGAVALLAVGAGVCFAVYGMAIRSSAGLDRRRAPRAAATASIAAPAASHPR